MKLLAAAFFGLLWFAHEAGGPSAVGRPLSMFRDGAAGWIGYGLFGLLLAAALWQTVSLARAGREVETLSAAASAALVLAVGLTPSLGLTHHLAAFCLIMLVFGHYAALLYLAGSAWLIAHLAVPVVLVGVTQLHSYGLWQKFFIGYLVLAGVARDAMLTRPRPGPKHRSGSRRRRVVYTLGGDGPVWGRRR